MESQDITASTTKLNDLHHYALLAICKRINNTYDQVAFAKASGEACDIFVNHVWKYDLNKLVVGPGSLVSRDSWENDFFLAKHLRNHITTFATVEEFTNPKGLKAYLKQLNRLGIKEFPKAKSCIINHLGNISKDMMLKLAKLMPNIKMLKLTKQQLSGRKIKKFLHLEELYMEHVYIKSGIINHIFKNLSRLHTLDIHAKETFVLRSIPVPTLRVLRVDADTAEEIMSEIMALPNLKELQIRYRTGSIWAKTQDHDGWPELASAKGVHNIWAHVIAWKSAQLTSIVVDNSALNLPEDWTVGLPAFQLPKLKELKFYNWQYDSLFLSRNLEQSNLTFLSMGDWKTDQPETLARTVAKFKQLQELEILDNTRDLYPVIQSMANVLKYSDRTEPLLVWNCAFTFQHLKNKGVPYWIDQSHVRPAMTQDRYFEPELIGFNVKFDNSPIA